MRVIASALVFLIFTSCAYLPSVKNKLEVRPLDITACEPPSNPVLPCGWLTAESGKTNDFEVTVGWGKFQDVVGAENAKKPLSEKTKLIFSQFAIEHVIALGYCKSATFVPHGNDLVSHEGSGDKSVHIRCN
ncbi:MAG: hypothetical protein KBT63_12520 [Porticoccaceae bacterium]|nr:hypothetical protein [Porticoccaceae bacterium]